MDRDVKDTRVVVKNFLTAIAMVYIPIKNQDLATKIRKILLTHSRSDAGIVKEAEPTRHVTFGMVTWRAYYCNRIFNSASYNCTASLDCSAAGKSSAQESFPVGIDRVKWWSSKG